MNRLKFITIGFVEHHKGQDILIDAIKGIGGDLAEECEFVVVGNKTSLYAQEIESRATDISCVKMIGKVAREEIHNLLSNSDVLICPSREDSMPTVCAEAMMHEVPCIVSSATGTAEYITNGYNGLIFESENVEQLKDSILWCINNRAKLKEMGKHAYEIYDKVFSEKAFEKNLLKYVEEMIGKATP